MSHLPYDGSHDCSRTAKAFIDSGYGVPRHAYGGAYSTEYMTQQRTDIGRKHTTVHTDDRDTINKLVSSSTSNFPELPKYGSERHRPDSPYFETSSPEPFAWHRAAHTPPHAPSHLLERQPQARAPFYSYPSPCLFTTMSFSLPCLCLWTRTR